ncbi:MAG: folate-binding protein [Zoogloeaceae bacterium]|jgi:folate-binding protein YgfZ|nr:folate-binding protein [Zoogloeaceae bacterium]
MNPDWRDFLASRGGHFHEDQIDGFGGDAQAAFAAADSGAALVPLTQFGLIRATGEDAAVFLHNLLSNDVRGLNPDRAGRCGFCTPKGRLLADFLVWREGNDYLLQLSADIQPALLKKLGMYVLRSKVKLTDGGGDTVLLGLAGAAAEAALTAAGLAAPAAVMEVAHCADGALIRLGERRFQAALRPEAAMRLWQPLSAHATPAGAAVWRWLDIAAGIPHITAPTQEEFVPQMANLDLIGGISFTKGCYPGQEVVARTKYLGKVKRRTYRVGIEGDCPPPGADLFSADLPGQSCGKIIEAAPCPNGCEALASMLMSSADTGDVRLSGPDGPRLSFLPLPYALD